METIKLQHKNSFGNDRYYPQCDISNTIVSLMGQACLALQQVQKLDKVFNVEFMSTNPLKS